jgi:pimeloyl-ACP methyl ester carboxylesterase
MALLFALLSAVAMAASAQPFPTAVTLTTEDGVVLQASIGMPAKVGNGVVFVHMAGRNKEDWQPLADKFYRQGLAVLTVDLRGHGANVTTTPPTLTGADWSAMVQDVRAGVAELRKRGAAKVALVGAEAGANLVINVAAADPAIASVALLSPGLDYKGILTGEPTKRYGARPLFLVASQDDAYGLKSATALESLAQGVHTLKVFEAAGKGTRMFNHEPTLESLLLGFVNTSWSAPVGPPPPTQVDLTVKSQQIKTTGTRLGEEAAPTAPAPAPKPTPPPAPK